MARRPQAFCLDTLAMCLATAPPSSGSRARWVSGTESSCLGELGGRHTRIVPGRVCSVPCYGASILKSLNSWARWVDGGHASVCAGRAMDGARFYSWSCGKCVCVQERVRQCQASTLPPPTSSLCRARRRRFSELGSRPTVGQLSTPKVPTLRGTSGLRHGWAGASRALTGCLQHGAAPRTSRPDLLCLPAMSCFLHVLQPVAACQLVLWAACTPWPPGQARSRSVMIATQKSNMKEERAPVQKSDS